ncbi:hypothetical protein D3C75_1199010 [compost metagenome]
MGEKAQPVPQLLANLARQSIGGQGELNVQQGLSGELIQGTRLEVFNSALFAQFSQQPTGFRGVQPMAQKAQRFGG